MRQIVVDKVSVSGFLSIADEACLEIKPGFHIVTGENLDDSEEPGRSNGAGKTTLPTAIEFAFYGIATKGSKPLTKASIPYWGAPKAHCAVDLLFDVVEPDKTVSYRIVRSINPNKLTLYQVGKEEPISQSESTATQKMIEVIIGIPHHVYNQCMYQRVNAKGSKFLEFTKAEREKFVNIVFDMTKLKEMEKLVRSDYNEGVKEIDKLNAVQSEAESKLAALTKQLESAESDQKEKEKRAQRQIDDAKAGLKVGEKFVADHEATLQEACKVAAGRLERVQEDEKAERDDFEKEAKKVSDELQTAKQVLDGLEDIDDKIAEHRKKGKTLADLRRGVLDKKDEINRDITAGDRNIDKLKTVDTCPTCNRPFDKDDGCDIEGQVASWKKERATLEAALAEQDEKVLKAKQAEELYNEKLEELDDQKTERTEARGEVRRLTDKVGSMTSKLEDWQYPKTQVAQHTATAAEKELDEFDADATLQDRRKIVTEAEAHLVEVRNDKTIGRLTEASEEAGVRVGEVETERLTKVGEVDILRHLKQASGESGVRQFILEKLITLFNRRLAHFIEAFEVPYTATFDGSFNATILNGAGKEYSYDNMSGGEQKRLDMAISFTFKEVLRAQNQIRFNFCVYDEIFDTSLDGIGREKILKYLEDEVVTHGEAVYVITNNRNFELDGATRIHMVKEDGKSTMNLHEG